MAYTQIQKISGSAASNFGKTVAIKGYYTIVADDSGSGYLYRRHIDGEWERQGVFTIDGFSSTFGDSLDIGNEYFVVGEPGYNSEKGRAGVYAINNPSSLVQTLYPSGLIDGDKFGGAVVISDEYILVGASGADSNKGNVYLFIKGNGGVWLEYSANPISPELSTASDLFGCAVAINNNDLIIGAEGDNNKTGAVYIFRKNNETELWEELQKIFASDGEYNDQFGETVSASGDYFVAGASLSESSTEEINAGAVYVYKYSTTYYEVDKLIGVDENNYESNYFGESVDINEDYIIVGSPQARNLGVSDIFYKKRSWGHLKKNVGDDSIINDDFGNSVGISGRFIVSGSPSNGTNGAIYYYEDPPVRLRLAQEFSVNGEYLPSKASIYLKRVGENTSNYWALSGTAKTVIDATNFSTIDYGKNIVMFSDDLSDFTGNGCMLLMGSAYSDFSTINYPIRAISPDTFNLWIRCISNNSSNFQADILLDGKVFKTIDENIANPSAAEWSWINISLIIPDNREHILGIKIKENGAAIDKIYIDTSDSSPYSEGPDYGESPYLTIHMQVYNSDNGSPNNALKIYDYKNSIDQVVYSDWYNFDINVLDTAFGYVEKSDFIDNYFLVMSCSGTTHSNFVVWEMMNNDEYITLPSAFRF